MTTRTGLTGTYLVDIGVDSHPFIGVFASNTIFEQIFLPSKYPFKSVLIGGFEVKKSVM